MKLTKADQEFRNPKVFTIDPKNVDLDRVLVNLFLLLSTEGHRHAGYKVPKSYEKMDTHHATFAQRAGSPSVARYPDVVRAWLENDVFDLVNRGKSTEIVASLRPLHLRAHKIRIAKHCRAYNVDEHMYNMLHHGGRQTLKDLRSYLDRGLRPHDRSIDPEVPLDLETLAVLKMVEGLSEPNKSNEQVAAEAPTCLGQARVLCDDVGRLLAYKDAVPRGVMIDYLKTVLGLHTALYVIRLARQLTGWRRERGANPACVDCKVQGGLAQPFASCPYKESFVVDATGDPGSLMARLAEESALSEYARLHDLIKSIFTTNQLLAYAERHHKELKGDPKRVFELLQQPTEAFHAYWRAKLDALRSANEGGADDAEESLSAEELAIFDMGLDPFDTFIEVVTHVRSRHHRQYLTQLLDRLLQKNTEFGALAQGKARTADRRWAFGGRLLEVFVQLAVLDWEQRDDRKLFYSKPILIEDFLDWLEARYGFVVAGAKAEDGRRPVTVEEHRAFRDNVQGLKAQLREIGFYDDLSDAYNAQTIRPRYPIDQRKEAAR